MNKIRAEFVLVLILAGIILIPIIFQITDTNKDLPTWIPATGNSKITNVVLLTLDFENTVSSDYETEFQLKFLTPGNEFISKSSGGKASLNLSSSKQYKAIRREKYYGEDKDVMDQNIVQLATELLNFTEKNSVLVAIHPGISQSLRIGNRSGLLDQYIEMTNITGSYTEKRGIIILSNYSPWALLVHEIGHYWGLPDLYFRNQIYDYGMMGTGVWHSYNETTNLHGDEGTDPTDFSPWSKRKLGWLNYWNATNLERAFFNKSNAIIMENLIIQYLEQGFVKPGVLVLFDKIRDAEFSDLLQPGEKQKYKLRSGIEVRLQIEENRIIITKSKLKNLNLNLNNLGANFVNLIFILLIIGVVHQFSKSLFRSGKRGIL